MIHVAFNCAKKGFRKKCTMYIVSELTNTYKGGDGNVKRITFALLIILALCGNTNAFEREEISLPIIGETLGRLETSTGWMKGPGDHWISRENRIPKYLSASYEILQDSEDHSLGVDNFQQLEVREIAMEGKKYLILLVHKTGGAYHYPTIKKDWYYNYQVRGYVFESSEFKLLSLTDKKSALVSLKTVATPSVVYYNKGYGSKYLNDISIKITEELGKERKQDIDLIFNVMKLNDKLRFVILEKWAWESDGRSYENYSGLGPSLPINMDEILTEEVFRHFYFETEYQSFVDFWNR